MKSDRTPPPSTTETSRHWKSIAALLPILGSLSLATAAELPPDWKFSQPVTVERAGFVKLSIPLETLDAARPGLEDLRLYDDDGRETPFLIERPSAPLHRIAAAKNLRVEIVGNTTVATMETGAVQPIEALELETAARDYIKAATLEGSSDGVTWQTLARGEPIFQQPGVAKQRIAFQPAVWAHLRLTLDDRRSAPVPVLAARVTISAGAAEPSIPFGLKIIERDELDGRTRFVLRADGSHIELAGLAIESPDPLFNRRVTLGQFTIADGQTHSTPLVAGTIYRIALDDQPVATSLTFAEGAFLPSREIILEIHNHDSPPLNVTAIRAKRKPVYLSWNAAQAGTFHLLSGNPNSAAPRYDLAQLPRHVSGTLLQPVEQAGLATNPAFRGNGPLPDQATLGAAIDLQDWRFRKRISFATGGVQHLEPDLETLSHANGQLADLRVVSGGKQLPYVRDYAVFTRHITPDVESAPDPKRPTVSRWLLRLPHARIPFVQLICEADAPLFKRVPVVIEDVPDTRGDLHAVVRSQPTEWVRAPGDKQKKLVVTLTGATATDRLFLEFDNGDNPPVTLKNIQLSHRVSRILFKAPTDTEAFLYYGSPRVTAPRYDLDLAARQMFAAEKSRATLGAAEILKKGTWTDTEHASSTGGWIFWSVLALVVIALLAIVARLLPSNPDKST